MTNYSTLSENELNEAVHKAIGSTQPFILAYSTDANLALSLIQDWCDAAPKGEIRCWNAGNGGDGISIGLVTVTPISPESDGEDYGVDNQPTFARAICIAFLSAMEEGE